eukprot:3324858-Rhodomonas_salina.1
MERCADLRMCAKDSSTSNCGSISSCALFDPTCPDAPTSDAPCPEQPVHSLRRHGWGPALPRAWRGSWDEKHGVGV